MTVSTFRSALPSLSSRDALEADLGAAARPEREGELLAAFTGEGVFAAFFTSLAGDGVAGALRGLGEEADENKETSVINETQQLPNLFEDLAMDFAGDAGDLGGESGGGARAAERLLLELKDESLLADAAAALRGGMAKIVELGQGRDAG